MGYKYTCKKCKNEGILAVYHGETSKSLYCRQANHRSDIERKKVENAMWKHCLIQHDGVAAEFTIESTGSHKTSMRRQINEAVRIQQSTADIVLNSRSEFRQAALVRVVPMRGLQNEQEFFSQPSAWSQGG